MDRLTVTNLLTNQYKALSGDLNIPETAATLYDAAVDMALRAMGVLEADLSSFIVADSLTVDYIALVDYFTLESFLRHTPTFADIQAYTPAIAKKRSQIFTQLRALRDDAAHKAAALGYTAIATDGVDSWQLGRVNLDYLEPDTGGF
jgi:hypothetical protein